MSRALPSPVSRVDSQSPIHTVSQESPASPKAHFRMSDSPLPVRDVAPQHRFDVSRLETFLRDRIEAFGKDFVVQQFQGGASNPTFLLSTDRGSKRYVLRKKPPGQLLSSAHQVDREFRVMKALEGSGVPVPHMR